MSRTDKLTDKLLGFPPRMRFGEVERVLKAHGYELDRVRGSHHIFIKRGEARISVPVHKDEVKTVYLKQIAQQLGLEEA